MSDGQKRAKRGAKTRPESPGARDGKQGRGLDLKAAYSVLIEAYEREWQKNAKGR